MDLRSKKVVVLLVTKTLPNLGNGLKTFGRPLREVVEPRVSLIGLQSVEPREFFRSWRTHLVLHEHNVEPNHVDPFVGCHLEHHEPLSSRGRP